MSNYWEHDPEDDDDDDSYHGSYRQSAAQQLESHRLRALHDARDVWTTGISTRIKGVGLECGTWDDYLKELRYKFGSKLVFDINHGKDDRTKLDTCTMAMRVRTWTDTLLWK